MPRDSNGNASTDPVYIATPGTTIRAVQHNTPIADIIQMLTGSLARNGTGGMLADLAMGGFKITGLANGSSNQDAVTKSQLDAATAPGLPALGAWTNVASSSTVDLGAQASRNLVITGTTTITSFGTAGAADNVPYLLRFSGVLTLTHSTDLILPGGANITTAAGDVAIVVHDTASVWRVVSYARAANKPLIIGTAANNLVALDGAGNLPAVPGHQLTGLVYTKYAESPEIALVAGGAFSFTHAFGVPPKSIDAYYRFKNAVGGFTVGQLVPITKGYHYSGRGMSLDISGVSIVNGRFGTNGFNLLNNFGSGADFVPTAADVRLVLRVFA